MANESSRSESWSFMQTGIGFLVVAGFFGIIFSWMYYPPSSTEPGILAILNQLTGISSTLAGLVVGYYFGSSKGSKDKDDALAASAKTSSDAIASIVTTGTGSGSNPKPMTVTPAPAAGPTVDPLPQNGVKS